MFGFGKKKTSTAPARLPSNPGVTSVWKVNLTQGNRSWVEEINLIALAEDVLKKRDLPAVNVGTWLHHESSGFTLLPQLVDFRIHDDGRVRTTTTIQSHHPTLVARGIFEYQHSNGPSIAEAITNGFDQWVQTDFVTLLDALEPNPKVCTVLNVTAPESEGKPSRRRRAVLGPIAHLQHPQNPAPGPASGEAHTFCPCCLLTKSFETFEELLHGEEFYALRLFAARDQEGVPQADCRVNGEEWEKGKEALREYVRTWEPGGFELRKQYVVFHTPPHA